MELVKYGILWLGSELGGIFYKLHVALYEVLKLPIFT